MLGWLLSLPNVPEGLFYLSEDEVDLDTTEYEALKKNLFSNYSRICPECLYSLCTTADTENEELGIVSPIKPEHDVISFKGLRKTTPMKGKGRY